MPHEEPARRRGKNAVKALHRSWHIVGEVVEVGLRRTDRAASPAPHDDVADDGIAGVEDDRDRAGSVSGRGQHGAADAKLVQPNTVFGIDVRRTRAKWQMSKQPCQYPPA